MAPPAAGGVDEHLAAAVLLHERGRREVGVELLGPPGDRPGRRGGVLRRRRRRVDRDEHVHALGPAGLDRAREPGVVEHLADEPRRGDRGGEAVALGRVEVEHEVGRRGRAGRPARASGGTRRPAGWRTTAACRRSLHSAYDDVALRCLRPQRHRLDPVRRVLGQVLLHERRLAAGHPDHRQRPVAQHRDDPVVHRVEVVDERPLGHAGPLEQRLVEVRQLDVMTAHAASVRRSLRRLRSAALVTSSSWLAEATPRRRSAAEEAGGAAQRSLITRRVSAQLGVADLHRGKVRDRGRPHY